MIKSKEQNKPFKVSFAGSSATTGRGNYFDESFPSVFAGILTQPLHTIHIDLEVYNAAVADVSTFPYGWCLTNFLGDGADVVSWDYGNSSRHDNSVAFEAYVGAEDVK